MKDGLLPVFTPGRQIIATCRPRAWHVSCVSPAGEETSMSTETILIIVVVILLLGGGGFYFRGRR